MIRTIIAEDDPHVAQLTARYLSGLEDLTVEATFSNGSQALHWLLEHPVELAIVDVYMPSCNGLELLRAIRGQGIRTAVIMITAATEMDVVEEALRLGIEDYIIKPFAYPRLGDAIRRYTARASLLSRTEKADQRTVDLLLSNEISPTLTPQALPKGLNPRTLATIQQILVRDLPKQFTCEDLSCVSGLSKVTVRHYLNYLIEAGSLTSSIDYETGGRPRVVYRLN